jgi:hypothetical protein
MHRDLPQRAGDGRGSKLLNGISLATGVHPGSQRQVGFFRWTQYLEKSVLHQASP